jgi:hypothetical protein
MIFWLVLELEISYRIWFLLEDFFDDYIFAC